MMTHSPLLFTFLDKVEGNGYLADIAVYGRLLAVEEDSGWWMNGVNPGGLAASGSSRPAAYIEFRKTLMPVLFDMAIEATNFYDIRKNAKKFFAAKDNATDPPSLGDSITAKNGFFAQRVRTGLDEGRKQALLSRYVERSDLLGALDGSTRKEGRFRFAPFLAFLGFLRAAFGPWWGGPSRPWPLA